jgi:hypothetical protein
MARGITRAPSQTSYRGELGRTRTEVVHVTGPRGELVAVTVHTSIDAVANPDLVDKLYAGELNVADGLRVAVPVAYHDPAAELLVLVLGEAHRHRELDERIRVLEKLRADPAPVPAYAKEFAVVFGGDGLRAYVEQRAQQAAATAREAKDHTRQTQELSRREQELARREQEVGRQRTELERLRAEARQRVLAQIQMPAEATTIGPPPEREDLSTKPVERQSAEEVSTESRPALAPRAPQRAESDFGSEDATRLDGPPPEDPPPPTIPIKPNGASKRAIDPSKVEYDEEDTTGASIMPAGSDPLTTETTELSLPTGDAWLDFAATGAASSHRVEDGHPRLVLVAGDQIARGLGGALDVRVLLHRVAMYPVVVLVIGPPPALRVPSPNQLAVIALDIAADGDRELLAALAKKSELLVDIVVRARPIRRVRLGAPLTENVAYIVRAADDHLRGLTADGESEPSFARARDLVLGAGYDLLGLEHAEHAEFRDDKLAQLETAQHVRRALAMARRFARPSREDYLVTARGFPLPRWRELRRRVLEVAVGWGLWMGPELAQIAVSEGLARSRRDLIVKLEQGFEVLRRTPAAFDIDADAADDNAKAIADEGKALGVELRRPRNGAIKSEDGSVVSGSIERTPTQSIPRGKSTEELVALLEDKQQRVAVASELCDRADPRAATAVIAAVKKMSRAEAVRILGKSVKFGPAAAGPLMEGLQSSKAFLRHGCALALALLRTDDGTHAVIQLLLDEPTEIWREIARAIGQIGPTALMPLASQVGRMGDRLPQVSERVAWAMAHLGVRGGRPALEQMASGQSVMAPLAKQALVLVENAARDEVRVRPGQPSRDVTVNRAFSRRFFEALEPDRPELAAAVLHDLEPHELDEADLIAEEEVDEELDESDLIQS